jgi:rhomboid protease GluP
LQQITVMPKKDASITIAETDATAALSVCYSAFKNLGWDIKFAGENRLLAFTPIKWGGSPRQIIAGVDGNLLTVSSETTGNEMVDMGGKNQQHIDAFLAAFEKAGQMMLPEEDESNRVNIHNLRGETVRVAAEQEAQAVEIDKALNLSGSNLYATYTIMAINILVFILMALNGAGIVEANGLVHLKWGSNYGPLTLSGDWWRLFTNVFIHFGIIHLAMNMYTLYTAGVYLEPLLGKTKYIAAYLCAGVLASVASLWWHSTPANSAGASGAIFGMYGLFLAFLTTNLIPALIRQGLLPSIGIFVVYNLVYGMKGGIDNAAHVGGLLSGFVIGYLFVLGIKKERQQQKAAWVVPVVVLISAAITISYLQMHKGDPKLREKLASEINNEAFKDNEKFIASYKQFIVLQENAMLAWKDSSITETERSLQLKQKALPEWEKAEALAKAMQGYDISPDSHNKANAVLQYVQLRKEEIAAFNEMVSTKSGEQKLMDIRKKLNLVVEALQ